MSKRKPRMTSADVAKLKDEFAAQMTLPPHPPVGYQIEIDDSEFLALSKKYKSQRKGDS